MMQWQVCDECDDVLNVAPSGYRRTQSVDPLSQIETHLSYRHYGGENGDEKVYSPLSSVSNSRQDSHFSRAF